MSCPPPNPVQGQVLVDFYGEKYKSGEISFFLPAIGFLRGAILAHRLPSERWRAAEQKSCSVLKSTGGLSGPKKTRKCSQLEAAGSGRMMTTGWILGLPGWLGQWNTISTPVGLAVVVRRVRWTEEKLAMGEGKRPRSAG